VPQVIDVSEQLDRLGRSLVSNLPELEHLDLNTILFTFSRSRRPGRGGLLARITPLRGKKGSRRLQRTRGRYRETWEYPSLEHNGREILYLITILLPRFLHLAPRERLSTILHELWHVSPACDGDIRRFTGARYAHGTQRDGYHTRVESLAERYLGQGHILPTLLTISADDWSNGHWRIHGLRIRRPRARLLERRKA